MRTTIDEAENNNDEDMNMAHRLELEGSGGGIRGEVDKGMMTTILFYSLWRKQLRIWNTGWITRHLGKLTILYNKI